MVSESSSNPWQVANVSDFAFFCCPECTFKTKKEENFEHHAVNRHPLSADFFGAEVTKVETVLQVESSLSIPEANEAEMEEGFDSELPLTFENGSPDEFKENSISENNSASKISAESNTEGDIEVPEKKDSIVAILHTYSLEKKVSAKSDNKSTKAECPICNLVVGQNYLKAHISVVHNGDKAKRPYRCQFCDFASYAARYLKSHIAKTHEKEKFSNQCDECGARFQFPYLLRDHKIAQHAHIQKQKITIVKKRPIACEECGCKFTAKRYLLAHYTRRHKGKEPSNLPLYLCNTCGESFVTSTSLNEHSITCNEQPSAPVKCDECGEIFKANRYLILHLRAKHGGVPPSMAQELDLTFMCDQCPNSYATMQRLKMHISSCHKTSGSRPVKRVKPSICPYCDKTFSVPNNCKEHIMVKHENITPFKCEDCGRNFGTRTRLKNHRNNVHSRVKCEECNQDISNRFMLKRHKAMVHSSMPDDVFRCDHCPMVYTLEYAYKNHLLKHQS